MEFDGFELIIEFFDTRTMFETQWAFWALFTTGLYSQFR